MLKARGMYSFCSNLERLNNAVDRSFFMNECNVNLGLLLSSLMLTH